MTTKTANKQDKNKGAQEPKKPEVQEQPKAKSEDKGGGSAVAEKLATKDEAKPVSAPPKQNVTPATTSERPAPGTRKRAGEENSYSYSGQGEGFRSNADMRNRVMELFQANPNEILTYPEVANKLGISKHHAWTATRDLEDLEDLVEAKSPRNNKKGHKLNPKLAGPATPAEKQEEAAK